MLIDGTLLPDGGILRRSVAIIGAGPAGLTVAESLAAAGIDSVVLEAGGRHHGRGDDGMLEGSGSGTPFPLVRSRRRGFGGTSGHWGESTGLRIRPLDEIDFRARPGRESIGWPFGREALEPYYDRAHASIAMTPGYESARWQLDGATELVWPGGPELALFQFARHDEYVRRFDDLVASPHVDIALRSPVRRIHLDDERGTVRALEIASPGGGRFEVVADVVVLAAGGIDNARVLLASPGRTGAGVGNEHDNVGRYFMDHLSIDTGAIELAPGRSALSVDAFLEHRARDDHHQAMLWLGEERIEREGLLNAAFWVNELDAAYLSPGIGAARSLRAALHNSPRRGVAGHAWRAVRGGGDVVGYAARRITRRTADSRRIGLRIMTEQEPDRQSRITLTDRTDPNGLPRIDLDWRISPFDLEIVGRHQAVLSDLLESHGIGRVVDRFDAERHPSPIMSNYHHMGSTRMHVDPAQGVVDADCRVHGVGNLFVAGSSVFPAGGYLNPTLTIIALALRIADRVAADLAPARVPQG